MTKRTPAKRSTTCPRIAFSDDARALVLGLAGWGMPAAAIATQVPNPETGRDGITVATLHEHFRDELENGQPTLIATAIRTQNDLMTKGPSDSRYRVSAGLLQRHGLANGALVVHVQTDPESAPSAAREDDAVELEKAILGFLHQRGDQGEP